MNDSTPPMTWKEQQRALTARANMGRRWHPKLMKPGAVLTTADGNAYRVQRDGSFRKLPAEVEPAVNKLSKVLEQLKSALPNPPQPAT